MAALHDETNGLPPKRPIVASTNSFSSTNKPMKPTHVTTFDVSLAACFNNSRGESKIGGWHNAGARDSAQFNLNKPGVNNRKYLFVNRPSSLSYKISVRNLFGKAHMVISHSHFEYSIKNLLKLSSDFKYSSVSDILQCYKS